MSIIKGFITSKLNIFVQLDKMDSWFWKMIFSYWIV